MPDKNKPAVAAPDAALVAKDSTTPNLIDLETAKALADDKAVNVKPYEPRVKLGTKVVVEPVHGHMFDTDSEKHIYVTEGKPEDRGTRVPYTAWVESQIDAGKLKLIEG